MFFRRIVLSIICVTVMKKEESIESDEDMCNINNNDDRLEQKYN